MNWCRREPTITEILSDSIVRSLMRADGVDPNELEAMLRRMSTAIGTAQDRAPSEKRLGPIRSIRSGRSRA
jgi:hypothetical protein